MIYVYDKSQNYLTGIFEEGKAAREFEGVHAELDMTGLGSDYKDNVGSIEVSIVG